MPITKTAAEQELFTNNYRVWEVADPPVKASNAPRGCSEITDATAMALRAQWMGAKNKPNSWKYDKEAERLKTGKNGDITRWVSRSVSGGSDVVDFHALWNGYSFLWHFKVVAG